MAILRTTEHGELILDISQEDPNAIEKVKDILFYFDHRESVDGRGTIVGNINRVLDIVPFLQELAAKSDIPLKIDGELQQLYTIFLAERDSVKSALENREKPLPCSVLPLPNRDLLSHQERAMQKLAPLENHADFSVPGSGKTTVAISIFHNSKNKGLVEKLMVIGPASCFMPWEEEWILCYGREPRSLRLVGDVSSRAKMTKRISEFELLLCTYQMAYRDVELLIDVLKSHSWMVILDESHNIKRYEGGAWAESTMRLAPYARKRMILSGTPVPRSLEDIWTQFTFLWPSQSLLGSRTRFEAMIREDGVDGISSMLRPFYHRTRKQDLGLPDPVVQPTVLRTEEWPPIQRKIVRILETRTLHELRSLDFSSRDIETIRNWRRSRIIRLLQAASNPGLLTGRTLELGDPGPPPAKDPALEDLARHYDALERSAKISYVVNKTRELTSVGKKVVIWTWFIGNIKLLERLLADLQPLTAFGEVKPFEEEEDTVLDESRERNIRTFRSDPSRHVLIANPSACSESISLHKECHDAIYVERTFNCGQFIQSMDRIHRVGMPSGETASYYLPIMDCAIDRLVDSRLFSRQEVLFRVLADDSLPIGGLGESGLFEDEYDLDAVFDDLRQILEAEQRRSNKNASQH